ncbi:MAG: 4Fe-4S binding protein [Candidatus Methanoperedens sp.]|nr:4Fe-4S binding protein [Candidatus Methanoperedens sp.]
MTAKRLRFARQLTQIISVILFFVLALLTYRGVESLIPVDLYVLLNPLVAFTAMIASRTVIAVMLLAFAAIVFGFVFGRAWCGWLCPLGAILDWFSPREWRTPETHRNWKAIKYVLLLMIIFAALLGNLSLLIFDPITILNRTVIAAVLPMFNVILVGVESALNPVAPMQPIFNWIEQSFRGTVLPAQQTFYQLGWMLALFFVGLIGLNWIVPRFWCRYLCVLGAVYGLQAKISWLRPRVVNDCSYCAVCMNACPTGAIVVTKDGLKVDPTECIACMDCVTECPESVIAINFSTADRRLPKAQSRTYSSFNLSRRHFIVSALASISSVALFRTAPSAQYHDAWLVRPPGAQADDFLSKCIRCSECIKVCPTGGLQPSLFESGLEGIWSPILVSRIGYCDYGCNACGQICPTDAIPPLTLEQKRNEIIGIAYIDRDRCIPWANYRTCVVCEEMCPVPQKAVRLEQVDVVTPEGKPIRLQRPHVVYDLCIGCGICEYQCPLEGPSAIRVYAPTKLPAIE